jgi:hypothetical protein
MPMNRNAKKGLKTFHAFIKAAMKRGLTHKQALAAWRAHSKKSAPKRASKKGPRKPKRGAKKSAKRSTKKSAKRSAKKAPKRGARGLSHIQHKKVIVKKFHAWLKAYAYHIGFPRAEATAWANEVIHEVDDNLTAAARHASELQKAKAEMAIRKAEERAKMRAAMQSGASGVAYR